jgi:Ca-activated chloride channel family protein
MGRVVMALGMPGRAATLFDDPAWRGVALYRLGDFESASEEFRRSGQRLNLGNSEVQAERYAAALEAYDIARLAGDPRAEANFDLVAAYYAGLALDPDVPIAWFTERDGVGEAVQSFVAQGSARAAGEGDESTNFGALLGLPELQSHSDETAVRKVFDDKFMVANRRWLETLSDVPGEFLAARIAHEQKRRAKLGLTQPEPEDPR